MDVTEHDYEATEEPVCEGCGFNTRVCPAISFHERTRSMLCQDCQDRSDGGTDTRAHVTAPTLAPDAVSRPRPEITIAATDAIALTLGAVETLDGHIRELAREHETLIGPARDLNDAARMFVAAVERFSRIADAETKPTCAPEDISGIAGLTPIARAIAAWFPSKSFASVDRASARSSSFRSGASARLLAMHPTMPEPRLAVANVFTLTLCSQ